MKGVFPNDLWERLLRVKQQCDVLVSSSPHPRPPLTERSWLASARRRDDAARRVEVKGRTMIEALLTLVTEAEANALDRP